MFRDQVQQFPSGSLVTDGLVMMGESLFQQQQYGPAREAFALARARKEPASSDQLQALALLHAAQSATQLEKWDEGLALLNQCAEQHPDSQYRDEVLYEQAWVKQNQGKLDEGKKRYEQVADRNQSPLGARARFMIGEIQFQQRAYRAAIRSFFKVAYGYGAVEAPEAFHAWQADSLFEAARCLEQLGKAEPAKRLYRELVEHYPRSNKVPDARKKFESL
jgi:TolA-binding protein